MIVVLRLAKAGLCPATTQGLVQVDLIQALCQAHLHVSLLQREQGALRIQQVQIAGHTVTVAQFG